MIGFIENIGIALLISGILSYGVYMLLSMLRNNTLGSPHIVGLGVLFLLLSYQSYRLMYAWDEKNAIEETMNGINGWADDAIDFINELDKQNGGNGEAGKQIKDAMNSSLMQKGLAMFGLDVDTNGRMTIEMGEKLKNKYKWYMFRRVCWMLGFILIFVIFTAIISFCDENHYRQTHTLARNSHRTISRRNYRNR